MSNSTRSLNLVFQGGGVRGIAYAGVLESMPGYCRLHAVGGTSAGAIVAALLAIGKTPKEITSILWSTKFSDFLPLRQTERLRHIKAAWSDASMAVRGGKLSMWRMLKLARKHRAAFSALREVWSERGIY